MHVISRTFHVPKAGTSERDYEDAAYPAWSHDSCKEMFRCAVADGATESSFAREWARRLVRHFGVGTLTSPTFSKVVPKLQQRWHRKLARRPLPWFAEEAASRGAFAAFVGMAMRSARDGQREWGAIALGDACLFLVREDRLRKAFPLETAEAFNSRPFLLSTRSDQWQSEYEAMQKTRGIWNVEDEFYLMTDALAQWFLTEHEGGRKPWSVLRDLDTDAEPRTFGEFVAALRLEKRIRNDDTTLVRVNVVG
jgi:hypothetical protein